MNHHLHILHLEKRTDRLENLNKQLEEQEITDYSIVLGEVDLAAVFRGINNSHKKIIRMAKQKGLPNCIIAEDDIEFTSANSWKYFLEQLKINKDADLFLSMIYEGSIDENNRIVKGGKSFSGMTLYSVNSKFYDAFLGMKSMAHIDKEIAMFADKYDYRVCNPFVAVQSSGWSDQKKRFCKYDHLLVGRNMYGG